MSATLAPCLASAAAETAPLMPPPTMRTSKDSVPIFARFDSRNCFIFMVCSQLHRSNGAKRYLHKRLKRASQQTELHIYDLCDKYDI